MDAGPGLWLTPAGVSFAIGISEEVARSSLRRLRGRGLAEDDGKRPLAFARTRVGESVLERSG
jgi:hypothetical protein